MNFLLVFVLIFALILMSHHCYSLYKTHKANKQLEIKRKEFDKLQERTIELQLDRQMSKEELKFEQDCLIIDAAYIDKKYGVEQYYKILIESEKGKT